MTLNEEWVNGLYTRGPAGEPRCTRSSQISRGRVAQPSKEAGLLCRHARGPLLLPPLSIGSAMRATQRRRADPSRAEWHRSSPPSLSVSDTGADRPPPTGSRHDTERHGSARHKTAKQDMARHSIAWHGTARHGTARHGMERHGKTRHGTARHGTARHGTSSHTAMRENE